MSVRMLDPRRMDFRRVVRRDVPLKVLAILLTALLWVVFAQSAAEGTRDFDGRVPIERPTVPEGFVLRGTLGDVAVKLRGPASAVAAIGQADLVASVDLAAFDYSNSEPQELPLRVSARDERVRVVEITPTTASVWIERVTERGVAVQVRYANEPPAGFQPGSPVITPAEVIVSGPQSLVAGVAAVTAQLRFGDVGVDLVQSAQPQAVDMNGAAVAGIQVDPAIVQVQVPVLPTSTTRTLPVLWTIVGNVADGYWIARITTDPAAVTVRGDQSAIAALNRIETQAIDVSGLTGARTNRVGLRLPEGVTLLQGSDVGVTVEVAPLDGSRAFPLLAIQTVGLGEGLVAEVGPANVAVTVSGTVPRLTSLAAADIVASVDLAGRGVGEHRINVAVRLPAGVTQVSVQPTAVTVTISAE